MRLGIRISQRNIDVSNRFHVVISGADFVAVNLGRWILANLFSGFIREEVRLNTQFNNSNTPIPASERTLLRSPAPMFISLDRNARRSMSESSVPSTMRTPGVTAAMASPSMAPAMLPDVPELTASPLLHASTTLPATLAKDTPTPASLAPPKDLKTPSNTSNQDYFSLRLDRSPATARAGADGDDGATPMPKAPESPSVALQSPTPGVRIMKSLKLFAKGKRNQADGAATPAPIPEASEGGAETKSVSSIPWSCRSLGKS